VGRWLGGWELGDFHLLWGLGTYGGLSSLLLVPPELGSDLLNRMSGRVVALSCGSGYLFWQIP
jgi:hypothetical protein